MEWSTYVDEATKTAPEQSAEAQLAQAGCGLADEVGEFLDADGPEEMADEASDICWYAALACDAMRQLAGGRGRYGSRPDEWALPVASTDLEALKMAAAVAGAGESVYWQEASIGSKAYVVNVGLAAVFGWLAERADLPEVWAANVKKLRGRHGSSFSPADEQSR